MAGKGLFPQGSRFAWVLLGFVLWVIGMGQGAQALEDQRTASAPVKKSIAAAESSRKAKDSSDQKLDQILANQEQILRRFDKVMEELAVIKIRATIN